jgi:Family of unknown function (DUF6516)
VTIVTIAEYLESVKALLLTDPLIASFQIIRERQTLVDGHLRVRVVLSDAGMLEFSEYVQRSPSHGITVITYSYHWADPQGNLLRRWDNTPHFPDLPGFPHHLHDGATNTVYPGVPINIFAVLGQIQQQLGRSSGDHT